jgi:hypothetical protein
VRSASGNEAISDAETRTALRLDGDRFQRPLAADAAGRRRIEAAGELGRIEPRRFELDRVRRQVVRQARFRRAQSLREGEAERELLVMARRAHRDGNRPTVDADLERLLDGDDVRDLAVRNSEDVDARRQVRRDGHPCSIDYAMPGVAPYSSR